MLPFVVPEFWRFGLLGTVWTGDWRSAPALVFILEFCISAFALHRNDASNAAESAALLYEVVFVHACVVMFGVLVGMAFQYATDFPPLLDLRTVYGDPQRSTRLLGRQRLAEQAAVAGDGDAGTPWRTKFFGVTYFALVTPLALVYATALLFGGFYSSDGLVPQSTANIVGVVFVVVIVVALGLYVCASLGHAARVPDGHVHSDRLQLKYAALFVLVQHTPVYNDFLTALTMWQRYAVFAVASLVAYALALAAGRADRYLGSVPLGRAAWPFALLAVVDLSVYLSSPLVATALTNTVDEAFAFVGVGSAVWIVLLLALAAVRPRAEAWRDDAGAVAVYLTRSGLAMSERDGRHTRARSDREPLSVTASVV